MRVFLPASMGLDPSLADRQEADVKQGLLRMPDNRQLFNHGVPVTIMQ
jgi:hypothetical protein